MSDPMDSPDRPVLSGPQEPSISATNSATEREVPAYGFPIGSVFDAVRDAVVVMGLDGRVRDWNPAAEEAFGYTRAEAVDREVAELIVPGAFRDAHRHALRRYAETGESTILDRRFEFSAVRKDGSEFPIELTVVRLPEAEPALFAGFIRNLERRTDTQRENARLQQRMAFLAQAGLVLDSSLEFAQTLHQLAQLTVPELAQIAVVDLLEDSGTIHTAVAAAADPADARAVEEMRREHPLRLDGEHPVAQVLRTGRPSLQASMSEKFQERIAADTDHYALMRRLRYHSAVVVPLVARQRVLGTLSLLRMEDREPFEESDLVLAEELGRRAALAVDNARLFEATRDLARTLQESLLPRAFPEIPGARITGRYRAAAQGQEVGGDFYDVFTIGDGHWGIAIGDVCGKGPDAAALTSLARYTIRALAGHDPANVLCLLNDNVLRDPPLLPEQLVTVLFAVASLQDDGLRVDVAAAGHPPPLVRRGDGMIERIAASGPLVGLMESPEYATHRVTLGPGDALLLYTDGLTDARAPTQILDEAALAELVSRGAGLDGKQLAEFLEASVTGGQDPRDDIALLVIELSAVPAAEIPELRAK
jgi:PAS domain S-box-containing protein